VVSTIFDGNGMEQWITLVNNTSSFQPFLRCTFCAQDGTSAQSIEEEKRKIASKEAQKI